MAHIREISNSKHLKYVPVGNFFTIGHTLYIKGENSCFRFWDKQIVTLDESILVTDVDDTVEITYGG